MIHLNSNVFLGKFIVPSQGRTENKQAKVVINLQVYPATITEYSLNRENP
jgi:hypothetical protein